MKVSQNITMQLTQKLALSNEMLQSLEIIQLPVMELKDKIDKELLENPALEVIERKEAEIKRVVDRVEEVFDERDRFYLSEGYSKSQNVSSGDEDSNRAFIEGGVSRKEGLHDWLHWQVNLLNLNDKEKEICYNIISFIDSNGFFKENIEQFADDLNLAEDMLETIQTLDPPGVGSAGLREALIYQIESMPEISVNIIAYTILKDHFDLLLERKDSQLAKILKISVEEVKEAFEFISQFEPYPGRAFDDSSNNYIVPDAYVYKREGELIVEINDDVLPRLTVSKYLEKIASDAKLKREIKDGKYATEKISDAKRFISIIQHRNSSLKSLIFSISKHQENFFLKGPKFLIPLTMKAIGEEIGLAESTISRLASSKYIQTEWGIHGIKYFFTNSINRDDEDAMSSESVREVIKEIIEENVDKKLSDQKISDILKNRGIDIARRTVSKYRNQLNILPSNKRNI